MRSRFFIIPAILIFKVAGAQNGPLAPAPQTTLAEISVSPTPSLTITDPATAPGELIMDYKSVYDAATLEEEVQMAAERFKLTKSQQEVWSVEAYDRRQVEWQAYEKLNSKGTDYNRDAVYKGLRTAQNTFYEIIVGYLNPAQKQALMFDSEILHEKQRRLAKLPPPLPAAPIVAPVDSTAIKLEIEKAKLEIEKAKAEKKSKKSKKTKSSKKNTEAAF